MIINFKICSKVSAPDYNVLTVRTLCEKVTGGKHPPERFTDRFSSKEIADIIIYRKKLLSTAKRSTSTIKAGIEEFRFKSLRDWTKLKDCLMNKSSKIPRIIVESNNYSKRQKRHFEKLLKIVDLYNGLSISLTCERILNTPTFFDQELVINKDINQAISFCEKHDKFLEQIIAEVSSNLLTNHCNLFEELIPDETKNLVEIFASHGKIQTDEMIKLIIGLQARADDLNTIEYNYVFVL